MRSGSGADCVIVTPRWNPDGGGRERYAAELVAALGRRGVSTVVLTLDDERRTERDIAQWRTRRPQAPILALEAVRGATHYQLHSGVLADAYVAERRSFPTPLRRAGAGIGLRLNRHRQRRLRREQEVCADPATRVWAFSRRTAAAARERFGTSTDRLMIGRPGIDLHAFSASTQRVGLPGIRALFVGHNFQMKGLAAALQALACAGGGTTLTIAGGDHPEYWRRLATRLGLADRVRFVGSVAREAMASLYRGSDVLLHPAAYDPFPRAALEALACGCPVMTTATCGISEILADGEDGWVIDATDVAGMAGRLRQLADDDVRRTMSAHAARTGRQFDFETHTTDVLTWLGMPAHA